MNAQWINETVFNVRGGVSSALDPKELPEDTSAWAKNVTHRGGKPRTRPPLIERLKFPSGIFQGISYFSAGGGMLVAQIGGLLYRISIRGESFELQKIPLGFMNSPRQLTAWMQETDGSLVIQDDQSDPIIYDGSTARRADPLLNEVPRGRMMAYGNGRLWVVVNDHEIKVGNIKDYPAGSELIFTETGYLTGGGAFYFQNRLRGLAFLPVADTSSGKGALSIFSDDKLQTARADITARDLWASIPGFITTTLPDIGTLSHHGIVPINQDLFFRAQSGELRSLRSARAEITGAGETPLSRDISRIIDFETPNLLEHASGIEFESRLLMTASPYIGPRGQVLFRSIIPLDFTPLHSMKGRLPPVFDGQWDGIGFAKLVRGKFAGKTRAFAVAHDPNGPFRLFEFSGSDRADRSNMGISSITAFEETRAFSFASGGMKKLEACAISLSDIEGSGTMTVHFRSDDHKQWLLWDSFTFCAKMGDAESGASTHAFRNLVPQFRSMVKLLTIPDDETSPITRNRMNVGRSFQLRLSWTGFATIEKVSAYALPLAEGHYANRADLPTDCVELETSGNGVEYQIMSPSSEYLYVDHSGFVYADHNADNYTNQ